MMFCLTFSSLGFCGCSLPPPPSFNHKIHRQNWSLLMNFAILMLLGTSFVRKKYNLWWVWATGREPGAPFAGPRPCTPGVGKPTSPGRCTGPQEPGLGSSSPDGLQRLRNGDRHLQEDEKYWSPETEVFQSGQCCLESNPWINGLNPASA